MLRGIYGCMLHTPELCRKYCVCGQELPWFDWRCIFCRSCYWVLTRQLVRHLLEQFGPWSHIHESIFIFLIQAHAVMRRTSAGHRFMTFAEVRQHGRLQG